MARGPEVRGGEGPPSSAHAGVATPGRPPAGSWAAAVPPACAGGWWARTHPEQAERVRVAFIWLLAGNQKLWTFLARMKDGKGRWRALEVTASNHLDALSRPISVSGQAISVGCSIGISFEGRAGPPTFSEEGRHGLSAPRAWPATSGRSTPCLARTGTALFDRRRELTQHLCNCESYKDRPGRVLTLGDSRGNWRSPWQGNGGGGRPGPRPFSARQGHVSAR